MHNRPRKRRARALLAAGGVAATLTLAACPFGNPTAPDCTDGSTNAYCQKPDMAVTDMAVTDMAQPYTVFPDGPFGNLKAPDCDMLPSSFFCPQKDGG
jgi:hypothetical protein